ncbi:MAG: fatty acid desaturase, partial [Proteobacteria bacterium]|nr:fatty acid desaturase [Pseudomonadota bacterium]
GTPLVAHRPEPIMPHNHTNMGEKDPDIDCANMTDSLWKALAAAWKLTAMNYKVFLRDRWPVVDVRQRVIFVAEIIGIVLARIILLAMPFGLVGPVASSDPIWLTSATLLVLVIGPVVGVVVLIYLFAYLVHVPHEVQGKFIDTSVYEPPAAVRSLITWLWGFQNYHGIHHAFPRVPWYRYRALFEAEKQAILRQGMPTHQLSGYRWQRVN